MKICMVNITVIILLLGHLVLAQKSSLAIPAGGAIELDYPNYEMYQLQLKNKLGKGIQVEVKNKATGEFVRGFGLGPLGSVEVMVEATSKIVFTNSANKTANITVKVTEMDATEVVQDNTERISFKLINSSSASIPLIIPNVMNPNLSPNSTSCVDLEPGQEILFKYKGKRYVLFTVDASIKEGDKIDVYELLQTRKAALGLK